MLPLSRAKTVMVQGVVIPVSLMVLYGLFAVESVVIDGPLAVTRK